MLHTIGTKVIKNQLIYQLIHTEDITTAILLLTIKLKYLMQCLKWLG